VEALCKDWPWFWPLRPSGFDLAQARERAGRNLAFYFIDHLPAGSAIVSRAKIFLTSGKDLRGKMWEYQCTSYFHPILKYQQLQAIEKTSESIGKEERFFSEFMNLANAIGGANPDLNKLQSILTQNAQRIEEIDRAIAQVQEGLKQIPFWEIVKRDVAKSDLKRLEAEKQSLLEYKTTLEELSKSSSPVTSVADEKSSPNVSAALADPEYRKIQAGYEKAYGDYVRVLGEKGSASPEVQKALTQFKTIEQQRAEALKTVGK